MKKPLVHCYNFATEIRSNYLEYLINNTPDQYEKAYLVSTGSEATEAALKLMRMYSSQFNKKSASADGLQSWCRKCINQKKQESRANKKVVKKLIEP